MPMRRLFIIGAGGLGRELESWLDRVPVSERDWRIHGYIDDSPDALSGYPSQYRVLGGVNSFQFEKGDLAVLALGYPPTRRAMVERLQDRVEFFSFIPPDTLIGKDVSFGRGVVVGLRCLFTTNIEIGDFAFINSSTNIGHDVRIGSFASLMGNVKISGKCVVEESVVIGTGATIVQGRRIREQSTVGAGAVVFRNVPPYATVVGNPAHVFMRAPDDAARTENGRPSQASFSMQGRTEG